MRLAEYPYPDRTLIHLTDTHLIGEGLLHGVADVAAHLTAALEVITELSVPIDAIVLTGDLADRAEPAAYERLRALIQDCAARLGGVEVIWCMGNHDDRSAMRQHLLGEAPRTTPLDRVHHVGGLRIIALDTTVPGEHFGLLDDAQLSWLQAQLQTPAAEGTVLALHHPPVPCVQDLAVTVELRDQAALGAVLRGCDVRLILAGHLHYSTAATFAGIPVHVGAATCYTQDVGTPGRGTRGRDAAQAFHLVHLFEHTAMSTVVPLAAGPTVGRFVDGVGTREALSRASITIPPPSRKARTTRPTSACAGSASDS